MITTSGVQGSIVNTETGTLYTFLLQFLLDSSVRLRVNEAKVGCRRFQPLKALLSEPSLTQSVTDINGRCSLF